jgi:hypothetical protein
MRDFVSKKRTRQNYRKNPINRQPENPVCITRVNHRRQPDAHNQQTSNQQMLNLSRTKIHPSLRRAKLPNSHRILIRLRRTRHQNLILPRRTSDPNLRASVILRQTMKRTKLPPTVRTLKRKKRFLPTLLTIHRPTRLPLQ